MFDERKRQDPSHTTGSAACQHPLFDLGRILATPGALAVLDGLEDSVTPYLARHERGDWGDLSIDEKFLIDCALTKGQQVYSVFTLQTGDRLKFITNPMRTMTTMLLESEG
jgi:hypothetical protein